MASVINTNLASLMAQRNLTGAQSALATSVERLSSGLRINRAKDDAAGLGISEKIKTQVNSLNQGARNANDAISMVQSAEGSLSEVSSILQRMKELTVQARNDSLSTTQRSFISDELVALKKEVNAIAERTTFNDLSLLKNALRTDAVASTAANKMANGRTVVDGVSIANLTIKGANAGSYTFTTSDSVAIDDQKSRATTKLLATKGADTNQTAVATTTNITLSGTYEEGDTISVRASGGVYTYTVTAENLTRNGDGTGGAVVGNSSIAISNIANGLAAYMESQLSGSFTQSAHGVVSQTGETLLDTTETAVSNEAVGAGWGSTATITISGTFEEGDTITYSIEEGGVTGTNNGSSTGSVTYTVTAADLTTNGDGTGGVVAGNSSIAYQNILTSLKAAYESNFSTLSAQASATISAHGNLAFRGHTSDSVSIGAVSVSAADRVAGTYNIARNRAAGVREITISASDIAEGNKFSLTIGEGEKAKTYSVVAGSGDTANGIASALKTMVLDDYPATATVGVIANVTNGTLYFKPDSAVSDDKISLRINKLTDGAKVETTTSFVSAISTSTTAAARTITLDTLDVVEGRRFTVRIGNPEQTTSYSVVADHDDNATSIGTKLNSLIAANLGTADNTTTVGSSVASGVISIVAGTNLGQARIELEVNETTEGAAVAPLGSSVSPQTRAASARTITINQGDLEKGNVVSVMIGGKEYAVEVGANDKDEDVARALAGLIDDDYPNTVAATATDAFPAATRVSASGPVITLTANALLGLEDITVSVKQVSDAGILTITAGDNTGIGGTSQSLDVGTIASGGSKNFNFDNLGVSFNLVNGRATAVDANAFSVYGSQVTGLDVAATGDGNALFQVGANTRDVVNINGFKDVRITGYNQNAGAEAEVFDDIYTTLTAISANTTESLAEENFATLENQIDDAITTVADFRSYLGAQQNRIEFAISNIQAQSENLAAANSRIRDTDYAAETANLTKTQIMQQAATAMLAQANQMPNVILALLK